MANGKGNIECACCTYFHADNPGADHNAPGFCSFHEQRIEPCEQGHRVCVQFIADTTYWEDNPKWEVDGAFHQFTPTERFMEFDQPIRAGVLYGYASRGEGELIELRVLTQEPVGDDHPRRRIERALLADDPFDSLWSVLVALKESGLPKAHVMKLLGEYADTLPGASPQYSALLRGLAILRGKLPAPK